MGGRGGGGGGNRVYRVVGFIGFKGFLRFEDLGLRILVWGVGVLAFRVEISEGPGLRV